MLTELQFEKMGVAIGQVASLQAVLGSGSSKGEEEGLQKKEGKSKV